MQIGRKAADYDFPERMSVVLPSGIRKLFDEGRRRPDCVDLSIGQADFDVPEPIKAATVAAIEEGCGRYSPTEGFSELVSAITTHLRDDFGLPDGEQVMTTSGASGALTLALMALVGPDDEVLMPDPHFVIYRNLALIAGARPIYHDIYPDFRLYPERVEEAITDRTRVLILNSPANPTGACAAAEDLEAVAEICVRRGVFVISDELYETFIYEGQHATIKRHLSEQSLLIGGLSKSYGMAGWRLGWAAGSPALIDKMRTLQQFMYTCPPTLVQKGALAAFGLDMSEQLRNYRRKRDMVFNGLRKAGYEVVKPQGAFFIFPQVPCGNDLEFTAAAAKRGVLVVPGSAFSQRNTHFRISFAVPDETLERGIERLGRLAG